MNKMKEFFNEKAALWDTRSNIKSDEFYQNFVKDYLFLKPGMKVLDLACGTGIITKEIYNITHAPVVGMDISDKMIEVANSKNDIKDITFVAKDFYECDLKGFDSIIVHNAYPHFTDKLAFKNKALEILNDNGYLIICHSYPRENINAKHVNLDKDLFTLVLDPVEEYKLYQDSFDMVYLKDEDVYVLVLQKRGEKLNVIVNSNRVYMLNSDGEEVGCVDFPLLKEGEVVINHTYVDESLRGQGAANKMMEMVYDEIKRQHLKARLTCSYAIKWFDKNIEKKDIIA